MTNGSGGGAASHAGETGKSLKDQNRWQLWIMVAANSLFLCGVVQANAIRADGLRAAFTDAQNLASVGVALVVATVLNGLVSADMKARLVFLRWQHALPGYCAFTKYAVRDPRIDVAVLEKLHGGALPVDPIAQNRAWYRLYKTVENDQAVRQVHRDFLLLRDYTALSALFLALYGAAGLYAIPSLKVGFVYLLLLVGQYAIARQSASNYGIRMVTTVLARRAAKDGVEPPKIPRKRVNRKLKSDASETPQST
ncbi:MAG: hypothetical protein JO033_25280 [Acidobacteriaceae bacterium]|nr:hypothetical protein [Acidobacteriaceae bacterium]